MTGIALAQAWRRRGSLAQRMVSALAAWARRQELRRYLSRIDEQALADLGVSRAQALFDLDRDREA